MLLRAFPALSIGNCDRSERAAAHRAMAAMSNPRIAADGIETANRGGLIINVSFRIESRCSSNPARVRSN